MENRVDFTHEGDYSDENLVAAGLAVVANDTGRVLMLQRALDDEDPASGKWEFPGGTIEQRETPLEAAKREWSEETGSAVPKGKLDGEWTSAEHIYRLFIYRIATEADLEINLDHEDRRVLNPDDPDGDQIETVAWWVIDDLIGNPALREEARPTNWNLLRLEPKIVSDAPPSRLSFSTEEILALVNLTLIEDEGVHYHWDPETQFYNQCHGEDGKFCEGPDGPGRTKDRIKRAISKAAKDTKITKKDVIEVIAQSAGEIASEAVTGRLSVRDTDGVPTVGPVPEKRGKRGASLRDPHEGTKTIDGVRGYDKNGKPVPGTDAYLEAHNISRDLFEGRPYIKYEASKSDDALLEAYPKDKYPKGHKLFTGTAEDKDPEQSGGYIMYKSPAPGSPHGEIAPQIRPNAPVVTDKGERAKAKTILENSQKRLEVLEKTTPTQLTKERRLEVKRAREDLKRAEGLTPEIVKAEATKNYDAAKAKFQKTKSATSDPDVLVEAKKELGREKRVYEKTLRNADKPSFKEATIETKTLHLKSAENQLANSLADPQGALDKAISRQKGIIKRESNTFDKTAAKYLFTPGVTSARIDVSQDPQNIKNLVKGKGRIYLAMEGSIKNDAILTAIRKEDPTAAVVNVPSVTLWQQKNLAPEIPNEMGWFAQKYAKDRDVVLIPDADGVKNNAVMSQAKALKSALLQNGAGQVYLATPPLKPGTTKVVEEFKLPSGKVEERKGIDDHLGAGRGTLGQLRYKTFTEYPEYDLTAYTKAGGASGKEKMSAGAQHNAEKVLAAISGLVEDRGVATIPLKTLNQTAGFRESQRTSARDAMNTLQRIGVIDVEFVYDRKALGRGERVLNPEMSESRRDELVKTGVIKEPHIYKKYVEVSFDESPVISIKKPEYIIKADKVHTGTISELPNWKPPATFKGWTSAVDGRPDSTGIAKKQEDNHAKFVKKNEAQRRATNAQPVKAGQTTKERLAEKKAPAGRRLVRTAEGAKRYGVAIGQPVPLSKIEEILSSMVLLSSVMSEEELVEFYNSCHDDDGRFCEGDDGPSNRAIGRLYTGEWPSDGGRPISHVSSTPEGSTWGEVDDVKDVYEVQDNYGNDIFLYDRTGRADRDDVDTILQNHAKMNEMYHSEPPVNIVVSEYGFDGLRDGDEAVTVSDKNYTVVNIDNLGVYPGNPGLWGMPSVTQGNYWDYVMSHEYGHHLDFRRNWDETTGYNQHPMTKNPIFLSNMSQYGHYSDPSAPGAEAYAEAFAEWHHTNGTTRNPSAIALARYEGWNGNEVTPVSHTASGAITNLTQIQLVSFQEETTQEDDVKAPIIYDNFEKGPRVAGVSKVVEPTKKEITKAEKILREVYEELGLEYKEAE